MKAVITVSPQDCDAVLFDFDGVLDSTASVHASAWKKLFVSFPEQRSTQAGVPFVPWPRTEPGSVQEQDLGCQKQTNDLEPSEHIHMV